MAALFTIEEVLGTITSLLTTELNALANNAVTVAGPTFDNTQGGAGGLGYERGYLQLNLAALSGNPAANSSIDVWFLRSLDAGATFEDGSSAITPPRRPDAVIPVDSSRTTAQQQTVACFVPACKFKALARNNALGEALAATTNTLKLMPATDAGF